MVLPDIKHLKKLLETLRSNGVLQYQSTELNLVLSELPPQRPSVADIIEDFEPESDVPTEEEVERILFLSADKASPVTE